MADEHVVASRVMQFCAGPQRTRFYACAQHRRKLDRAALCFLLIDDEPVELVEGESDEPCDFCREG